MKLLFDENLSHKLPRLLASEFPAAEHVIQCGLGQTDDSRIREYCNRNGFVLVTKDSDFSRQAQWLSGPPKVIWLRHGNAPTAEFVKLLRSQQEQIEAFATDQTRLVLVLT